MYEEGDSEDLIRLTSMDGTGIFSLTMYLRFDPNLFLNSDFLYVV